MKILKLLLSFMFICNLAFADSALDGVPGLIYLKNFAVNQSQTADYANGSNVITATAARSATAPDTYIDSAGKINISTTADTLLFDQGYYDTTGFHVQPGLHAYGSSTNYVLNSYFSLDSNSDGVADSWSAPMLFNPSLVSCSINNISGGKGQRAEKIFNSEIGRYGYVFDFTTNNDSFNASTGPITCTASYYVRGDISNLTSGIVVNRFFYVEEQSNDGTFQRTAMSYNISSAKLDGINSGIKRISHTFTVTDTDTRKLRLVFLYFTGENGSRPTIGESFWIEIYGVNLEKSPYATPFIPTTTEALTRQATIIRSPTANNRNASEETIIAKFAPCSNFANDGVQRDICQTATVNRQLYKSSSTDDISFKPNRNYSDSVRALNTTNCLANKSDTIFARCKHSSPYASVTFAGGSTASYTAGDWINPAWGSDWFIGSGSSSLQLDGRIQSIAIFNRALTDDEVTKLSSSNFTLNNNSLLIAGN